MKARRRRGLLLLSVALVSGGLAASQVRERERSVEARVGPAVPVLVAARDLAAGARIGRAALELRQVPARFVPPDSLASAAGVIGARTATPLAAGSYLTASAFEGAREGQHEGGGLARGERAVTVEVAGASALPQSGPRARVDVLVSTESAVSGGRTVVALAGVELLRLEAAAGGEAYGDPEAEQRGPTALATLRVSLREAVYLTEADNFAREIRLLARPSAG